MITTLDEEVENEFLQGLPDSPFNETLIHYTRPPEWQNPTPDGVYNLVVLGGGSAGLVAVSGALQLGAKVALIEKNNMGGDCLNVGCVPSKALIKSAELMGYINRAEELGYDVPVRPTVRFRDVMERVYSIRAEIAPHDSVQRYTRQGADVYIGVARFSGPNSLIVDGRTLHFKKAVIATGSRPRVIPIDGLKETGFITNETLWNMTEQPESLAIIGGGPIGAEMAQALQRLGTQVTIIELGGQLLGKEDKDAAAVISNALQFDGVHICLNAKTQRVFSRNGKKVVEIEQGGQQRQIEVDEIMLSVGRSPNVEGLNLEAAGVDYDNNGIKHDDHLKTTNDDIYVAGDVGMKYKFTHAAGHAAAITLQNALFPLVKRKLSSLIMPWCTYTSPEVAHVGIYPDEAREQGIEIDTYRTSLADVDRGLADGRKEGFAKIHVKKGSDEILGATIVADAAGEMINEITVAMKYGLGLGKLTNVIHPYPTQAEAIYKASTDYSRTRLTPLISKALGVYFKLRRLGR